MEKYLKLGIMIVGLVAISIFAIDKYQDMKAKKEAAKEGEGE